MENNDRQPTRKTSISWLRAARRYLLDQWSWYGRVVLLPFVITRLIWVLVGLFAVNFAPNPTYAEITQRGWFLSPHFLIDMWSHWDAKWYLSIVEQGYSAPPDLTGTISNIAFFPLYPYLIKAANWLLPDAVVTRSLTLLIGLFISNLGFLAGAGMLYRLALHYMGEESAGRTLGLYFVFPTSFFFSAFYTESLFFVLAVASFAAAFARRWWLSGILAGLLAVTRPQGFLVVVPLFYLYMQSRGWKARGIRLDFLAFLTPVLLLAAHLYHIYPLTGSLFAPVLVQKAWGKLAGGYLESIWNQVGDPVLDVFKFDLFFLLLFLITSLLLMRKHAARPFGIYAFLIVLLPLLSGSVISISRYILIAFPVFAWWGCKLRSTRIFGWVQACLWAFQTLFFLGWINYYWVG